MDRRCRAAVLALAAGLAAAAPLAAQDAPPPLWRTQIDLGLTDTRGNSRLTTVNLGEKVEYRPGRWLFTQTLSWVNGYNQGVETANNIKAAVRADYTVSPRLKLYGLVMYERNPFAGLSRRFEESVGLAWSALTGPRDLLDFEAGAGVNQQRAGTTESFPVGRLAGRFRHNITAASYVQQTVELLENLDATDDARVNSETSLVAPLSSTIALRLSYQVQFDNVPVPGKKQTDTVFASGIQIVF